MSAPTQPATESESPKAPKARPLAYAPNDVLTPEEVAEWLGMSKRTLARQAIRRSNLTAQRVRYLASDVYDYLRRRAA